ncbi:uncharacterized protein LOC106011938 [Aplysia californica]|uniref:Uncharacterized protein LOC106011938 n=1 Tax=Aplysia californica TaxID=6500 RepID=A0ABM1A133_APLCA|nr:uncharacterized protein LOC106011938 [Aplysia californica]
MGIKDTSLFWKVGICLQAFGLLFAIIGFATNHMVQRTDFDWHSGLWKLYSKDTAMDIEVLIKNVGDNVDWVRAARAMTGISLGFNLTTIGLSLVGAFYPTKMASLAAAATAAVSVAFGVIGSAVCVAKTVADVKESAKKYKFRLLHDPIPDWSYGLFMGGQLAYCVVAVLHFVDSRSRSR